MIKVFEMFAGYGGASFGLKKAEIPFECVGYSEIDKYAIQCYEQNHKGKNYGDCTKINPNELPDFDLLTGGFPCQSFSSAGKGLGELDTRGTLFYEIIRIAEVKKPKYMLLENVKGLTFKKHRETFNKILSELDRIGYKVYWKVLNSKEYGIPQNRERVFFVCFRKDIKNDFEFPQKEELKIFLKDILEEEVDEKYFLKEEQIKRLIEKSRSFNERIFKKGYSPQLYLRNYKDPKIVQVTNPIYSSNRIYSQEGLSPTLKASNQPFILIGLQEHQSIKNNGISNSLQEAMGKGGGYIPIILDLYNNKIKKNICPTLSEPHHNNLRVGVMNTITEAFGRGGSSSEHIKMIENVWGSIGDIRKLTPKEYFRLMGFLNDEINLEGLSNTQKYKLAGNGWDINLVSKIFKQMFK